MHTSIEHWLSQTLARGGSDLHLSAGAQPMARVLGELQTLDAALINSDALANELKTLLPDWLAQDHDDAVAIQGLGRFRVNVFAQARGWSSVWRCIPEQIPRLQDLNMPVCLTQWLQHPNGLLLVTGATGSGKSTTLAALLAHLNHTQPLQILTLEDPIEFVHHSQRSLVQQRNVPGHSADFATALRAALRQDPDVILVGELRDLPTIELALRAAETGHLVLATLHTRSATQAIERLVDVFPGDTKALVRQQLSLSLLGVVHQVLCKSADGCRRV
ncbi:MAG: PilT/PilU family type 4a pilus ATPase, partial [Betaproteobacteria bacterium]|nr:PilT/PilU family type 4a pilus ATPase [Betaproteobacteria bacterium]